ncbi:hypothetical protein ACEU6F_22875, partial [Aeromonas salmonicida]|uniref:hypothetical protein n=1 Tax=Aeromonas salmonicida TaxID=645 RepID=UPI0035A6097A
RPVGDGVKRRAHDADLKEMVVIRSPSPQLVPFKLHRFGQQRPDKPWEGANKRGNASRLTQSFHFFMFEPFFLP